MGFGVLPLRGAAKVVAASDSIDKTRADYVCDGTDDQDEIKSAIAALGTTGGKVLLLEGTYSITRDITLDTGTALVGQGAGTVLAVSGGASVEVVSATDKNHVLVANLKIDGSGGTGGTQHGIYFSSVTHSKIINCWVENMRSDSILLSESTNNTVHGNNFQSAGRHNIVIDTNSKNNTIHGNNVQSAGIRGISLTSGSDHNTVTGNNCQSNGYHGIHINASSNNTVTGNNCQSNGYHGIFLEYNANNNTVAGNSVKLNDRHGIYVYRSSYNSIVGNTLHNNSQGANDTYNEIFLDDNGVTYSTYNTVEGNTIKCDGTNKAKYGIRENAAGDDYNIVTRNVVNGPVTGNVSTQGANTVGGVRELFIPALNDSNANATLTTVGHYSIITLADGVEGITYLSFKVPDDFVSFESVKIIWTAAAAADKNMRWKLNANYAAAGEVLSVNADEPAFGLTACAAGAFGWNVQEPANPLTLTNLAKGDHVGIRMTRDGAHADDTLGQVAAILGLLFTYVAQ